MRSALALAALTLGSALSGCGPDGSTRVATQGKTGELPALPGLPNVYSGMVGPDLDPAVAGLPVRVYVPNSDARSVSIIDPERLEVVDQLSVGRVPHHVTPSPDLRWLYVNNTEGDQLTRIHPASGKPEGTIPIVDPYNLYFTPDASKAIVVAERFQRLDFFDPASWRPLGSVRIPWPGVDHGDFTADGRHFVASAEFSGHVVKVDTETFQVVDHAAVGSLPVDVKLAPDGSVFYVADQGRHGVFVLDADTLDEVAFLPTGRGAHGLQISRRADELFVSNRLEGSISVIDLGTRSVARRWHVGGSPDMLQVSADGHRLWASNRFHGSVSVIDTATGAVVKVIRTGAGAHGLTLFPQPGGRSIGHNGVYR